MIPKPRQERFLEAVKALHLKFPVAEISDKTGIGQPTVSIYLNAKREISLSFLRRFCEVYGVDYDYIKDGKRNIAAAETSESVPQITSLLVDLMKKQNQLMEMQNRILERSVDAVEGKIDKVVSSLDGLAQNQNVGFGIVTELLRRDIQREEKGNPGKVTKILDEISRKIGPDLGPKLKEGIVAD